MKKLIIIGSHDTASLGLTSIIALAISSFSEVCVTEKIEPKDVNTNDHIMAIGSSEIPEKLLGLMQEDEETPVLIALKRVKNGKELFVNLFGDLKPVPLVLETLFGKEPLDKESKSIKKVQKDNLSALFVKRYNDLGTSKIGAKNQEIWKRLIGKCELDNTTNTQDISLFNDLVSEGEDYVSVG